MKRVMAGRARSPATIRTRTPILTVYVLKDGASFMAKCPQLDLVTEHSTDDKSVRGLLEMIGEYARDYRKRAREYAASPNRSHHRPYVERVLACRTAWDLRELVEIRYGHVHV